MTAQIIDGKALAKQYREALKSRLQARTLRPLCLAVILVGEDPASQIYIRNKEEACKEVGINSIRHLLPANTSEEILIHLIHKLNHNQDIDGILLQLPLPQAMNAENIINSIDPHKDVDGFHAYNLGRLVQRRPLLRPCTPQGIMAIFEHIKQPFQGKHAVVVGASTIVGRPMALELLIAGATVTVCHRLTEPLEDYVKTADILVTAVGKPGLIKGEWIKRGATVIDVGITRLADGSIRGDVDFDVAKSRAAWITPVPGGVGPMTVTMLLENTLLAANLLQQQL